MKWFKEALYLSLHRSLYTFYIPLNSLLQFFQIICKFIYSSNFEKLAWSNAANYRVSPEFYLTNFDFSLILLLKL